MGIKQWFWVSVFVLWTYTLPWVGVWFWYGLSVFPKGSCVGSLNCSVVMLRGGRTFRRRDLGEGDQAIGVDTLGKNQCSSVGSQLVIARAGYNKMSRHDPWLSLDFCLTMLSLLCLCLLLWCYPPGVVFWLTLPPSATITKHHMSLWWRSELLCSITKKLYFQVNYTSVSL